MKYIDADKLKAEIDKRYREYRTKSKGDKYYEGMADSLDYFEQFIDSLQQKSQEEICSKCIHHGKDDGYCYNPHGGMQSWINENGIYKCTGFCEKEQEQPEVDLEKEMDKYYGMYRDKMGKTYDIKDDEPCFDWKEDELSENEIHMARHFYELGKGGK